MSSLPNLLGSSETTPPRGFLYRPGFTAFAAGVKHAMLADTVLETFGLLPNKKQKMAPVRSQQRKGTYKKRTTYKKKASATSVVKKAMLQMAQTYHETLGDDTINSGLVHNSIYTINITAKCAQGTGIDDRQGDQIYLSSLKLKGSVVTPTTAGAYQYRLMVLMSGEEYNPAILAPGNLTNSDLFLPSTGITWNINGQVNSKAISILYDQRLDVNSTITGVADIAQVDMVIPLNRKFAYQSDNGAYGKTQNLYVVLISSVAGGVSGTTSTGQVLMSSDLLFKNL